MNHIEETKQVTKTENGENRELLAQVVQGDIWDSHLVSVEALGHSLLQ